MNLFLNRYSASGSLPDPLMAHSLALMALNEKFYDQILRVEEQSAIFGQNNNKRASASVASACSASSSPAPAVKRMATNSFGSASGSSHSLSPRIVLHAKVDSMLFVI